MAIHRLGFESRCISNYITKLALIGKSECAQMNYLQYNRIKQPFLGFNDVISGSQIYKRRIPEVGKWLSIHSTFEFVQSIVSFWFQKAVMDYPTLKNRAFGEPFPFPRANVCKLEFSTTYLNTFKSMTYFISSSDILVTHSETKL